MDEREPVWRESGRNFIGSVTTLLERLLDYRNALQVGALAYLLHSLRKVVSINDVRTERGG